MSQVTYTESIFSRQNSKQIKGQIKLMEKELAVADVSSWFQGTIKVPEKKHSSFTLSTMKTAILVHYCCERKIPRLELSPVPLTS